jgi:coronin-1B/1C/6
VQDIAWSADGSQLITSTKDKLAKIWDPRAGTVATEWTPHEGGKAFKTLFLGSTGQVLTVGFTRQSKREFKVWEPTKSTAKPLATFELDQASGVMIPFYDEDTRMLYLTGKVRQCAGRGWRGGGRAGSTCMRLLPRAVIRHRRVLPPTQH